MTNRILKIHPKNYNVLYDFISVRRRDYLASSASIGTVMISGCSSLGNDQYTADAEEYLLSHRDIGRILSEDFGGEIVRYDEIEGVESGAAFENRRHSLVSFGLLVCESVEESEILYDSLLSDTDGWGEELDIGDGAVYDAIQGSRLLGVRLSNVMIQMNGRADFQDMERLAETQIDEIKNIG